MKIYFNAPDFIVAGQFQDFNGITYYFKENGNVIIEDLSLGATYRYGKYEIHENKITIRGQSELFSHKLIIRNNELHFVNSNLKEESKNEMNSKNSNLKSDNTLQIHEDNR